MRRWNYRFAVLSVLILTFSIVGAAQNFGETTAPPALKTKVQPKYTQQALQAGITGKAVLLVKVDANGVPVDVRFVEWKSSDGANPLGLDKAAIDAVRQWRFYPSVRWGRPGSAPASIELEFDFHRHPEQVASPDEGRPVKV